MSKNMFSVILFRTVWLGRTVTVGLFVLVIILTGIGIVWNSLPYFLSTTVGFLRTKIDVLGGSAYLPAFYAHILVGFVVLVSGLLQFNQRIIRRFKVGHQWLGRVYVMLVLLVMAPSGLVMGFHANGGLPAQLCFMILASFWWYYTFQAYHSIRKGQIEKHITFMHFSYALTLSAVMLRVYSFLAVYFWGLRGPEVYQVLVWLSWVPNVPVAMVYLRAQKVSLSSSKPPAERAGASSAT